MEKVFYLEKCNPKSSDFVFPPSYEIKGGKMRLWMSDGSYREGKTEDMRKVATDQIMKLTLGSQFGSKTYRYTINIEYKQDPTGGMGFVPADSWEKDKHECVYVFLMQHPLCTVNGKATPNTRVNMFNVVDVEAANTNSIDLDEDKMKVKNMLRAMEFDELKDVCFYFARSPKNKKAEELRLLLGDWNTGVLFTGANMADFLKLWTKPENMPIAYINAHKAVEYGIIKKRPEDNKFYYETEFVGTDYDRIVEWFEKEKDLYEGHILREIRRNDGYKDEKAATVSAVKIARGEEMTPEEVEELRERTMGLQKRGFIPKHIPVRNMGVTKLKQWNKAGEEAEQKASIPVE